MKTPQEWHDKFASEEVTVGPVVYDMLNLERITAIQSDAFAAGKAQGRVEGLREAARIVGMAATQGYECFETLITQAADRMEREQQTK